MKRLASIACCLLAASALTGCERCGAPTETDEQAEVSALEWDPGPVPEDVPRTDNVYQQAYDRALEELDVDAAAERLGEIERDIARERRGL